MDYPQEPWESRSLGGVSRNTTSSPPGPKSTLSGSCRVHCCFIDNLVGAVQEKVSPAFSARSRFHSFNAMVSSSDLGSTLYFAIALAIYPLITQAGTYTLQSADADLLYNAQLQYCPQSCQFVGSDTASWTSYSNLAEMALCAETMLFSLNVHNLVSNPHTNVRIRACSTSSNGPHGMTVGQFRGTYLNTSDPDSMLLEKANDQLTGAQQLANSLTLRPTITSSSTGKRACGGAEMTTTVQLEIAWVGGGPERPARLADAASRLAKYFRDSKDCGQSIMFAYADGFVLGALAQGDFDKGSASQIIMKFGTGMTSSGFLASPSQFMIQTCGGENHDNDTMSPGRHFSLFADSMGNISAVQDAISTWVNGGCLDGTSFSGGHNTESTIVTIKVSEFEDSNTANITRNGTLVPRIVNIKKSPSSKLQVRANCRDIQVQSGDSCAKLASDCGISGADFMKYNKKENLCSTLMPKQYVCCNAGDLPDHTPQPNADGTCFSHAVQKGEGCWSIGEAFGINQKRIEDSNKKTWAWAGCDHLQEKQVICLSKGDPPSKSSEVEVKIAEDRTVEDQSLILYYSARRRSERPMWPPSCPYETPVKLG